jgi:HlyD family secretion protein
VLLVAIIVVLNLRRGEKALSVQTTKVKKGDLTSQITAPGQIKPVTQVKISANTMGKITRLPLKEGDRVKRSQLLLEIDPAPIRAQVDQFRAARELTRAQLEQTERLLRRARELFEQGLTSREDLEGLETQLAVNRAQLTRDDAALQQAREELSRTTIISPLDGIITELNVELGEVVVTGTMNNPGSVIMTVADLSRMEVEAKVDESEIRDVRVGQSAEVTVDALPDTTLKGVVSEVGSAAIVQELTAEQETPDFKVKVEISSPPASLRTGMSATVKIMTAARKGVLTIPIQAVVLRDIQKERKDRAAKSGKKGGARDKPAPENKVAPESEKPKEEEAVYLVSSKTAEVRAIRTGASGETDIEILSGLKEGEEVIAGPYRALRSLHEGDKVKATKEGAGKKTEEGQQR